MDLAHAFWAKILAETTPEKVAEILIEVYGSRALEVATGLGLAAYADERLDDYLYWVHVSIKIHEHAEPPEKGEA